MRKFPELSHTIENPNYILGQIDNIQGREYLKSRFVKLNFEKLLSLQSLSRLEQ